MFDGTHTTGPWIAFWPPLGNDTTFMKGMCKARCTRYDLSDMILLYMTSRTVYTGVFRVA